MEFYFRHRNTGRVENHEAEHGITIVRQFPLEDESDPIWAVHIDGEFVAYTEDGKFVPGFPDLEGV